MASVVVSYSIIACIVVVHVAVASIATAIPYAARMKRFEDNITT